jgi:RND family efflux transporter MFP subunit
VTPPTPSPDSTSPSPNGKNSTPDLDVVLAEIARLRIDIEKTAIRAPFAGVVARKLVTAGDLAAPGQPLLEVEGTGAFEIELGIPDSLAATLAPDAALAVTIPASGLTFRAPLRELSSAADALARTVTAKLSVPADAKVRSGQFARIQVPGTPAPALLVPASAVSRLGQMERVFALRDGHAEMRLVKTGATRDGSGVVDHVFQRDGQGRGMSLDDVA